MIKQFLVKDICSRLIVENFESFVDILVVDSGDEPFLSAGEPSRYRCKPRSGFRLWLWRQEYLLYVYERCGIGLRGEALVGDRGRDRSLWRLNSLRQLDHPLPRPMLSFWQGLSFRCRGPNDNTGIQSVSDVNG